ncbi:unnamed protein product [Alopecurus aequalis]
MKTSRKAKRADRGAGGSDRLSELPDCLLHVILSQLKARQVVQTCVLGRRWKHLWLTSPCLDVDISEFLPHAALHPTPRQLPHDAAVLAAPFYQVAPPYAPPPQPHQNIAQEEEFDEFEDFVDCLLIHRSAGGTPPLDTLQLRIPPWWLNVPWMLCGSSHTTKYTSWIRRGLRCCPSALDVSGFVKIPRLASSSTRRLTKLRLDRVILHRDFAEHLRSGLPVLEDLEISGTELSSLSRIESAMLKHIAVESSSSGSLGFTIAAPRLVSLHLAVQFLHLRFFGIDVQEAPRLVRASIRLVDKPEFRQRQGFYYVQEDRALLRSLCNLLGSLSHVGDLKLYGFHGMTVAQQHIPFIPPPAGGPGQGAYPRGGRAGARPLPMVRPPKKLHKYFYQPMITPQPAMPRLNRPMLAAILDEGLPVFHGLTSLVLDECETGHELQTLWRLLHNAPVLEKLTLRNCQCQMFPNVSSTEQPRHTILETASVSSSLKLVEIIYDDRDVDQGGGQYKARINKVSSSMIEWKLPATTIIRVTKLREHN